MLIAMLFYAAAAQAPSWTDKLEAWATLLAAIFSAAAFIIALYVLRREQRTRREDKHEAEIAQARKVYAELAGVLGSSNDGWTGVSAIVHNNSLTRITSVRVEAQHRRAPASKSRQRMSPVPGDVSDPVEVMFPKPFDWPFRDRLPMPTDLAGIATLTVVFRDSEGHGWRREGHREPVPTQIRAKQPSSWWLLAEYVRLTPMLRRVGRLFWPGPRRLRNWLEPRLAKRHDDDLFDPA